MFANLKSILEKTSANYADLRYEVKKETRISYKGKELSGVSSNTTDGYVLRVLKDCGLSTVAFTKMEQAQEAIKKGEENAALMGRKSGRKVSLAPSDPVVGEFAPELEEDPRGVSLEEKTELLRKYNSIPLSFSGIATTELNYFEVIRERYFLSSEGSKVHEDLITVGINGLITSREGNLLQNVRIGTGGSHGFAILRDKEELF